MIDLPTPALIGMVHLPALPGSVAHMLSLDAIIERAVQDAAALQEAGFDALVIENFGDAPFAPERIPPANAASLAIAADHVRRSTNLPIGINALRNDAMAAIGIAASVGAQFVRINVLCGVAATDQGMISGKAHEVLAYRRSLGKKIAIFADVHVKHATPISQPNIAEAAKDTAYRGLADAIVVSGSGTGEATSLSDLATVRKAVPDRRLVVGSGATANNIAEILAVADGAIVGSSLKLHGDPSRPIEPSLAKAFISAARGS